MKNKPKTKSKPTRIWDLLSTVLVALVVLMALFLVLCRVAGYRAYTVLSGSMEPSYHVGSLLFVRTIDPLTVTEGQVISFLTGDDSVVTHRVVQVIPDADDSSVVRFRTKGDANEAEDPSLVHCNNLIGTPIFTIPVLGYLANYIQHPPGTYIAIAFAAVILFLAFMPDKPEEGEKK